MENRIHEICGELQGVQTAELTASELMALARAATQLANATQTLVAVAASALIEIAETEERGPASLLGQTGARNTVGLVQTITGTSANHVNKMRQLGDAVRAEELQHVTHSARRGTLNLENAAIIIEALGGAQAHPERDQAERSLVQAATGHPCGAEGEPVGVPHSTESLRRKARRWQHILEPERVERGEEWAFTNRSVRLRRTEDGLISLNGRLVPEAAALLENLFGAAITSKKGLPDARTPDQKRHDALVGILSAAARSDETPMKGGAPVSVVIQVTPSGKNYLQGFDGELTPVSGATANHGACAGSVQTLAQNEDGGITRISSNRRIFTAHQRKAIGVRDGGCVIPGCEIPQGWCEIHHVIPHSRGGPTSTDNGVMLCWYHHRHLDGWQISMQKGVPKIGLPPWLASMVSRPLPSAGIHQPTGH